MSNKTQKPNPYWVGLFSVLDMSGDSDPFESLVRCTWDKRGDVWDVIGRDFDAVGRDLSDAIVDYFQTLPRERQVELVLGLAQRIKRDESPEWQRPSLSGHYAKYLAHHAASPRAFHHRDEQEEVPAGS